MKEIKFRVWNDEAKVWILNVSEQPISWLFNHAEKCKFMQFTGLKDSQGLEVYEGDIFDLTSLGASNVKLVVVKMIEARFVFYFEELNLSAFHFCSRGKVIGNIYENSELLNQEIK